MHQCHFTSYMVLYVLMCIVAIHLGLVEWMQSVLTNNEKTSTSHRVSKRSIIQFRSIIQCYQPWVDVLSTYGSYGCWCGYKGSGRPLDDTDKCCYLHDKCYDEVDMISDPSSLAPPSYITKYEFQCIDNRAICDKTANTALQSQLCECDRAAAECFTRSRSSYSSKLFFINAKRFCTGKDKDLEGLYTGKHILDRLYSCSMDLEHDRCCVDRGYNSAYEICCNGKIRLKDDGCGEPSKKEKSFFDIKLEDFFMKDPTNP